MGLFFASLLVVLAKIAATNASKTFIPLIEGYSAKITVRPIAAAHLKTVFEKNGALQNALPEAGEASAAMYIAPMTPITGSGDIRFRLKTLIKNARTGWTTTATINATILDAVQCRQTRIALSQNVNSILIASINIAVIN